ncbi:MAG TPA: hypothetical protein VJT31_20900 [Rugosimonospora sp.]|nr:hypothetical protein [Rugosimonospora sp.]
MDTTPAPPSGPHLLANLLDMAAQLLDAPDLGEVGVCDAVIAAMQHARVDDRWVFADAVSAVGRQPTNWTTARRVRAAATQLREGAQPS